jgi:hypothetical protein
MKPIHPGRNIPTIIFAKDQPQYIPLPAHRSDDDDAIVTSRWRLTFWERLRVLLFGDVWIQLWTFTGRPQPVKPSIKCPL